VEEVVGAEVRRRLDAVLLVGDRVAAAVERRERTEVALRDRAASLVESALDLALRVARRIDDAAVDAGVLDVLLVLAELLLLDPRGRVLPERVPDVLLALDLERTRAARRVAVGLVDRVVDAGLR